MSEINISLKQHLLDSLYPLLPILPSPLNDTLANHLSSQPTPETIPYSLLQHISRWSRSPPGHSALKGAGLDVHSYDMIALLAGNITSPERNFPPHERRTPESEDAKREMNDRRAVVAVINSLLSIAGAGVATWWAAGVVGWRDEWKALFALFVSAMVAIAEGILFLIWDSRRTPSRRVRTRHKKDQDQGGREQEPVRENQGLRRRK